MIGKFAKICKMTSLCAGHNKGSIESQQKFDFFSYDGTPNLYSYNYIKFGCVKKCETVPVSVGISTVW